MIDKEYCMCSFLTYRYIANPDILFAEGINHSEFKTIDDINKVSCATVDDIDYNIRKQIANVDFDKTALLLSGGIDSGIIASYMPAGSVAYTVSNPSEVSAIEIERAKKVCDFCGIEHRIVEVSWNDYTSSIDMLMQHDGCPVFANEPQVYALSCQIKKDGFEAIIFGDNADVAFGGMDGLLAKDWTYSEFVNRYTFVDPKKALKKPVDVSDTYKKYRDNNGGIDVVRFLNEVFAKSSTGAYVNAFDLAKLTYIDPYASLKMSEPLDLKRVRSGESKYMLRELYNRRFPEFEIPEKIAMARAVDMWLKDWEGPNRDEFLPNCSLDMTGEQKFMLFSLERFLNIFSL